MNKEIFTMADGCKTKDVAMEFVSSKTVVSSRANGQMTNSMEQES